MISIAEKVFQLKERQTSLFREGVAGTATFLTMFYILIVNPPLLVKAGVPPQMALWGTCLGAVLGCLAMGLLANAPFSMAPGLGLNAYFALTLVPQIQKRIENKGLEGSYLAWQVALGLVFVSGCVLLCLNVFKFREILLKGIPLPLRWATGAGIGLLISVVGFQNVGWIVPNGETGWSLGQVLNLPTVVVCVGLVVALWGLVGNKPLGLFWSLVLTTILSWALGLLGEKPVAPTSHIEQGISNLSNEWSFPLDFEGVSALGAWDLLASLILVGLMDSVGTIGALVERLGPAKEGKTPVDVGRVFTADAVGIQLGALMGTSPLTVYVESATGVMLGGRTGLTACTTALLFLISLFFFPFLQSLPAFLATPVLLCVGGSLFAEVLQIKEKDVSEYLPAFLCLGGIGLTLSVTTGLCWGFLASVVIKCVGGRWKELSWVEGVLAILLFLGSLP